MKKKYWCDWGHQTDRAKVLPTSGGANAIICRRHFYAEMYFRAQRNRKLDEPDRWKTGIKWNELKDYEEEPTAPQAEEFYIHSRCCNAHWELVLLPDEKLELRCEKCGKATNLVVKNPGIARECAVCSKEDHPGGES